MLQTEDDFLHRQPPFSAVPFCVILALTERKSPENGGSPMTFDEMLAQVLELLQQEKRVSYRALKRRFALDDEYLEDLKDEIIKAKRLAMDEECSVLVWTGDAQTITSQADQSPQQPAVQAQRSAQPAPPPDAERRQLTVMFIDLVESTSLSSQLDPEQYRDVVRAYQRVCSEVIT